MAWIMRRTDRNNDRLRVLPRDYQRRSLVLAIPGFTLNCGYAVVNLLVGAVGLDAWHLSLGVYYLLLALMRLSLLTSEFLGRHPDGINGTGDEARAHGIIQWRIFRRCGALLAGSSIALGGVSILIVLKGHGYRYSEYLIYAVATYTFVKMGTAIWGTVKCVRLKSPKLMCLRNISLADAAVSMLALQTAMFTAFGAGTDATLRTVMNIATGAGVCALVAVMGLSMTIVGSRRLRGPGRPES